MIAFLLWYLVTTILGWLTFPLAYRMLPGLPDRGYSLARALGLLVWGYCFWLLASLGILQNNTGGILFALAVLVVLSLWAGWRDRFTNLRAWVREHKGLILTSEFIFLLAFAAWALVRAANPDVSSTEKPMEMAFINAILHSPTFPPHDPWLAGYAISYYYFGYVMVAMLVKITGVASPVAFNLAVALWFALTAVGAYGLVFSLLVKRGVNRGKKVSPGLYSLPIFGPLFLLMVSNFEGILDVLHARGLFWSIGLDGKWTSSFWQWLDIQELTHAPPQFSWLPTRPGGIVWWRASRVLQDYRLDGLNREIIDEFPFFSYLLGDLHPHVLAMPFALLVIALALNFYFLGKTGEIKISRMHIPLAWHEFLLAAVALGGLAFLNTWDFPIYVALFSGVYVCSQYRRYGWSIARLWEFIGLGFALGVGGFILYLPFYLGFQSQASGILPSLVFFTRGVHFWVMFGPLLIPIILLILILWRRQRRTLPLSRPIFLAAFFIFGLLVLSFLWGIAISFLPKWGDMFLDSQGALNLGIGPLLSTALADRLKAPGTWLTLGLLLAFTFALLQRPKVETTSPAGNLELAEVKTDSHGFVLLLVLLGIMLTLAPEFFYLLDQFGWRMNTIFKLYFQTWIIWGVAAAYASVALVEELRSMSAKIGWVAGLSIMLLVTFAYPVFALPDKTEGFKPAAGLNLNGIAYLERYSPDDAAAIQWLQSAPLGVVCEAVGGQYSGYARISTFSGQPTVLGWPGHVSQWRGGSREIGSRQSDVDQLYRTSDWQMVSNIINQYQIRYIYIGDMERSTYRVNEVKFQRNLKVVYQKGSITIYEVPDSLPVIKIQPGMGQE
jgi:YYY domain-containing protein